MRIDNELFDDLMNTAPTRIRQSEFLDFIVSGKKIVAVELVDYPVTSSVMIHLETENHYAAVDIGSKEVLPDNEKEHSLVYIDLYTIKKEQSSRTASL